MKLWRDIRHISKDLKSLPPSIKRFSLISFIYYLSWGILDPFLPIYFKDILGNYTDTALVIGLLYIFAIFWSVPLGSLADRFSKKTLISFFLLLYLPLGPILSGLTRVWHFTVFRVYHSFLATGLWTSGEAYVRFHSAKKERYQEAIGFSDAALGLASVLGAILGGILVSFYNIRLLFWLMPVFVLLALVFNRKLPDHSGSGSLKLSLRKIFKQGIFSYGLRDFWKNGPLVSLTFLSFLFAFATSEKLVVLSLLADSLGAKPIQLGLIFALFNLPILFEAPFSVFARKYSDKKILIFSSFLTIFVLLWLFFLKEIWFLVLASFLLGVLVSFAVPILEGDKTRLMPLAKVGELNGVTRGFTILGGGLGILIILPLADKFGIAFPFLASAVLMALFVILIPLLWRKIKLE
ncbi:MAG: MFS transporter [Patescibacteria group bacterium]